jgi:hypothetical protein
MTLTLQQIIKQSKFSDRAFGDGARCPERAAKGRTLAEHSTSF